MLRDAQARHIIAGEQLTPVASWRIRLTEDLRDLVTEETPEDYLACIKQYDHCPFPGTQCGSVSSGEVKGIHVAPDVKKACVKAINHAQALALTGIDPPLLTKIDPLRDCRRGLS